MRMMHPDGASRHHRTLQKAMGLPAGLSQLSTNFIRRFFASHF
jgi:hypothetical protein